MSVREHVRGPGPDRRFLPNFKNIMRVENFDCIKREVIRFVEDTKQNDLFTKEYNISNVCDVRYSIPKGFRHILLQGHGKGADPNEESSYIEWKEQSGLSNTFLFMKKYFPRAFRTRLAILPPKSEFGWHIDMNTSVSCRFQLPIVSEDCHFEVRRRKTLEELEIEPGVLFFANTAYPHRICNFSSVPRISLLFSIRYSEVSQYLPVFDNPAELR